jgi:hypothetical protein
MLIYVRNWLRNLGKQNAIIFNIASIHLPDKEICEMHFFTGKVLPPSPLLGAALEIFPLENQKKPLGFHVRIKIEMKKTSKPSQQNNSGQPQNCLFLISLMATKMHTGVLIT